jgi:hypothetical protein
MGHLVLTDEGGELTSSDSSFLSRLGGRSDVASANPADVPLV